MIDNRVISSNQLVKNGHYRLPVVKEKCSNNYFVVTTADGEEFSILKLRYQKQQEIPDLLDVYVKDVRDGYVTVGQDISVIIPKFYSEGNEYFFKVMGKVPGKKDVYNVSDENGLYFHLTKAPEFLPVHKTVKCKVEMIKGVFVLIKYAGSFEKHVKLQYICLKEWLNLIGHSEDFDMLDFMMRHSPAFKDIVAKHDYLDSNWIFDAMAEFAQNVTKYLIAAKNIDDQRHGSKVFKRILNIMEIVRESALYIVEGSTYLKDTGNAPEQRTEIQEKLSGYIEMFKQIAEAANLIAGKKENDFIDNIFKNLQQAGYLYHPSKQFRIMMTILRLRPELMSDTDDQRSRITLLFEALHSWPQENWMEDPFRTALVDQLEIFIRENCDSVTLLPANESSIDNRQLNRIIRAIAIQSLLAKPDDNIDQSHNKAMFYRFLSHYHTHDTESLLYKGVGAILGNEYIHDFNWHDTASIGLLQEKASRYSDNSDDFAAVSKVYATSEVTVELRPRELTVKSCNADESSSVLPNNTVKWMSPKIFLEGRVKTPSQKKINDLAAWREMWTDIENSIFTHPEQTDTISALPVVKRPLPPDFEGSEVEVIIDGYDVDRSQKPKHQLRFHCVVFDSLWEGEGWLTSCPEDFIPWLNEEDYPNNYNGDTSIFCDEDGHPLLYKVKVKNAGSSLHFTMKREVDNYLRELPTSGDTCHAVIRHLDRNGNCFLCLTDKGYTLKVPLDDENRDYQIGSQVTVRYIELENKNYAYGIQFGIGEIVEYISDPQLNFHSKMTPLRNIMQGLGRVGYVDEFDEKDSSAVIEAQEVMSREEMVELVLMLQRRAYAEKEYISAFNYLGLGAVLARAAQDNPLYEELKLHQRLLSLLQHYAKNKKVDYDELEQHKEDVEGHPLLEKLYSKLHILSSISRPDANAHLWEMTRADDETISTLASLVLSLNLLPDDSLDDARKEITNTISTMLNVNSNETKAKYYGEEDQHLEFKSSLVFTNRERDHMQPRPEAQQNEIIQMICGFLNSEDGRLYIGVNDLGYEAGLYEDLRYRKWKGKKASLDAMIVDLENAIAHSLPSNARDNIRISIDPESTRGVLCVEVTAVRTPVPFDGIYYVRNSSSTRPKIGRDADDFLAHRAENYDVYRERLRLERYEIDKAEEEQRRREEAEQRRREEAEQRRRLEADQTQTGNDGNDTEDSGASTVASPVQSSTIELENGVRIMTGNHRLNTLHDGYVGVEFPSFYLHFDDDNTFFTTHNDLWAEDEPGKRLVLAVKDKEVSDLLVIGYEDGSVATISLEEIKALEADIQHPLAETPRIKFINIAKKEQYLLSFVLNSSGYLYARADLVDRLQTIHTMKGTGKRLYEGDFTVLAQEIADADRINLLFNKAIELSSKLLGMVVKLAQGETVEEKVRHSLTLLAHND